MVKIESPEFIPEETIADVWSLLVSTNPDRVKRSILMASLDKMTCDFRRVLEPYQIPLLTALILSDNQSAAQILIDCKVDVNRSSAQQMTPLFVAAARGCIDAAVALLSAGAELEPDSWCPTPLFIAAEYGHDGVVKELLAGEPFQIVFAIMERRL